MAEIPSHNADQEPPSDAAIAPSDPLLTPAEQMVRRLQARYKDGILVPKRNEAGGWDIQEGWQIKADRTQNQLDKEGQPLVYELRDDEILVESQDGSMSKVMRLGAEGDELHQARLASDLQKKATEAAIRLVDEAHADPGPVPSSEVPAAETNNGTAEEATLDILPAESEKAPLVDAPEEHEQTEKRQTKAEFIDTLAEKVTEGDPQALVAKIENVAHTIDAMRVAVGEMQHSQYSFGVADLEHSLTKTREAMQMFYSGGNVAPAVMAEMTETLSKAEASWDSIKQVLDNEARKNESLLVNASMDPEQAQRQDKGAAREQLDELAATMYEHAHMAAESSDEVREVVRDMEHFAYIVHDTLQANIDKLPVLVESANPMKTIDALRNMDPREIEQDPGYAISMINRLLEQVGNLDSALTTIYRSAQEIMSPAGSLAFMVQQRAKEKST